ncbi:MAG: protease complex subunit PrcB family protein [Thermoanaerobaculia bacterium]
MRVALLLTALAFNTCTTANVAEKTESKSVEIETIARGGYAVDESDRKAVLATSDADYRSQWQALINQGDIPSVDFDRSVVVFLLAGMRNTGGWSIAPESARVEGDTAVVKAKIQGPPPGGITTQAITYPYAVVAIHVRGVGKVRWDPSE